MKIQIREPISESLKFGFLGDIVPGFPEYKPVIKDRRLMELLDPCDLVIANIESPLTNAPSIKERGISLRSDPKSVKVLNELNINVANLANNHIFDCGLPGLEDTLNILAQNKISCFGAGRDIKHSSRPFIFESTKIRMAFLAFSYEAFDSPSIASNHAPGANPLILDKAKDQIAQLRKKGYIVCVSYHGGDMFFRIPNPKCRSVLRDLAQAGAHIVIGHHAHVFQGIEVYNDSIIAYGLGNFYWSWLEMKYRGENVGLLLNVELDRLGPCAFSAHIIHNQWPLPKLSIVQGHKEIELLELLKYISDSLIDQTQYIREWRRDCCRKALGMNHTSNNLWLLKAFSRAGRFSKFAFRTFIKKLKGKISTKKTEKGKNNLQPRTNTSTLEIIPAAIKGFPIKLSDFRHLNQCYRAYEVEPEP